MVGEWGKLFSFTVILLLLLYHILSSVCDLSSVCVLFCLFSFYFHFSSTSHPFKISYFYFLIFCQSFFLFSSPLSSSLVCLPHFLRTHLPVRPRGPFLPLTMDSRRAGRHRPRERKTCTIVNY